jgi:hypothetical protein
MKQSVPSHFWIGPHGPCITGADEGGAFLAAVRGCGIGIDVALSILKVRTKQTRNNAYQEQGFTPTYQYKHGLAEIAVDASTRQLALTYGGDVSILNGSEVVKCKAGKTTSTSRPDVFDKDKKVRETVYHLDIWTRDLDRPNFRIEFFHATQMEQWRARISALAED